MDQRTRAVHVVDKTRPEGSWPFSVPLVQFSAFAVAITAGLALAFSSADALAEAMAGTDGRYVHSRRGNATEDLLG